MTRLPRHRVQPPSAAQQRVIDFPIRESDAVLVSALKAGRAEARAVLFDRHADDVERILFRVLGPDSELPDLLHEVFIAALGSIDSLRDPRALSGWLRGIAIRKARKLIVRRTRWRIVRLFAPADLPEVPAVLPSVEVSEALRCTYEILAQLPADERVAFALRFIDGMELTDVAETAGVSLATIKRRISRAREKFVARAAEHEALSGWLEGGEEP